MISDALNTLNDSQVHTTNTTTVSTDSIDLGNVTPKRAIGDGEPMALVVNVEAVTGAADTITIELISSTAAALNANVKGHGRTRVLTAAEIPVGTNIVIPIPPGAPTQRYLGYRATLGNNDALTATGKIMPLSMVDKQAFYATAISII